MLLLMKNILFLITLLILLTFFISKSPFFKTQNVISGAPPYEIEDEKITNINEPSWLSDWKRPEGLPKVALQVGHWKTEEVPDELKRLRGNTGSSGAGKAEWEVNMRIAQETKRMLEEKGIVVELLPATIPPNYWADVFIAIHADGSTDPSKSGYKAAIPRRDYSGKANKLLELIESSYGEATSLDKDPNVTRNMRGYYAFSWWRYDHAVHPMTTSLILETGFLTSASDRELIVNQPEISAEGISNGIIEFLELEDLI